MPNTQSTSNFFDRLKRAWVILNSPERQVILYAVVCAALLFIFAVLPGGFDYKGYFYQLARGCVSCTYNPYFTEWFLRPLGIFEDWRLSYLIWIAVTMALMWPTVRVLGGNPFVMLFSPVMLWVFWLGQIDAIAVAGIGLAWWSLHREPKNPWLAGLGLLMMATKPQLTGFLILAFVWWAGWKALVIPGIAAAISFALYGLDWPMRWLQYTPQTIFEGDAWFYISVIWLLPTILGVFLAVGRNRQMQYLTAATLAGAPYLGVYSFYVLTVLPMRWWEVAAGYVPFLVIGLTGDRWWLGLLLAQPLLVMTRLLIESRAAIPADVELSPASPGAMYDNPAREL